MCSQYTTISWGQYSRYVFARQHSHHITRLTIQLHTLWQSIIYASKEGRRIMVHCIHHQHWSDHGGSFPTEEVAGWILGMLPEKYKRLMTVELNMYHVFAALVRHTTNTTKCGKNMLRFRFATAKTLRTARDLSLSDGCVRRKQR